MHSTNFGLRVPYRSIYGSIYGAQIDAIDGVSDGDQPNHYWLLERPGIAGRSERGDPAGGYPRSSNGAIGTLRLRRVPPPSREWRSSSLSSGRSGHLSERLSTFRAVTIGNQQKARHQWTRAMTPMALETIRRMTAQL